MHQELAICIYYNYLNRPSLEVGCRRPRFFSQFSRQGGRTESVSYLVEDPASYLHTFSLKQGVFKIGQT